MSDARQQLGKSGEDLACDEITRRGYVILARRYRRRGGEIDIIARDGPTVVFIEVKTRTGRNYGDGGEAVNYLKRRRLAAIALDFLSRERLTHAPCRFDVVSIDVSTPSPGIEFYQNAFDVN
ncbi:MAG: YraN family protein [Vicinamibacterales bacterium]